MGWQSGNGSQGELSGIERMIQEIEMGSFIRIENYQMEDLPVDEREWSFIRNKRDARSNGNFASGIFCVIGILRVISYYTKNAPRANSKADIEKTGLTFRNMPL